MKTTVYELMMQHFQLRKVNGPAAEAKGLWANDLNPSTASVSSISPIVIRRKTITDFSSQMLSHFNALPTDSEATGGRNVEGDEDDEELRRNTEAARNAALEARDLGYDQSQPQPPHRFSFKTRTSQLQQVQDVTSHGLACKSEENASRSQGGDAGASLPRRHSVESTQTNRFLASKPQK